MKLCMLCGEPTTGCESVTGIHISFLCQPCKDIEDQALADSLKQQSQITEMVLAGVAESKAKK